MTIINDQSPVEILKSAKNILLVDWPDQGVPRALLNAGFSVFGYSPGGYTQAGIVAHLGDGENGFAPRDAEKGFLVFSPLPSPVNGIDIVNVYRPEQELAGIITNIVLPSGAKVLWLHPPGTSATAKEIAAENNIVLIEGTNIAEIASEI
jgi:hypothetical protein